MFNLFKKGSQEPALNFSGIGVDMHSHVIPGIDDGAQNMGHSIALIHAFMDMGFRKIITTPHIMADYYRNTPEIITHGLNELRKTLINQNISFEVEAAAEYYLDETFETKLDKGNMLTLNGEFLLFEISFVNYPHNLTDMIKKIQDKGYKPILAHPERYPYLFESVERYHSIKETGCYFQLNTISLTGHYGKNSKKIAEELIDHQMIDFIGSDMHHVNHAIALKKSLNLPYVHKLLTDYQLQNILL
ncbi:MAG: capsular biosynthesis protein [Flavobacterium sp.]|nr:capsular biosynthesis protein [Pedobacter sp.]